MGYVFNLCRYKGNLGSAPLLSRGNLRLRDSRVSLGWERCYSKEVSIDLSDQHGSGGLRSLLMPVLVGVVEAAAAAVVIPIG